MIILETISRMAWIFLPILLVITGITVYRYFDRDRVYIYPSQGWMFLKENPIPDDATDILITDGKRVKYAFKVDWAPNGKVFYSVYDKTYVIAWQPMPEAPKYELKQVK